MRPYFRAEHMLHPKSASQIQYSQRPELFPYLYSFKFNQIASIVCFIIPCHPSKIDNWVRPFFKVRGLDGVRVLGTQIEVIDGRLTGKFKSNNCYGEEKVHRICEALTTSANAYGTLSLSFDRAQYEIEAFGDSRGDKEMLAFANKGHYKPF